MAEYVTVETTTGIRAVSHEVGDQLAAVTSATHRYSGYFFGDVEQEKLIATRVTRFPASMLCNDKGFQPDFAKGILSLTETTFCRPLPVELDSNPLRYEVDHAGKVGQNAKSIG